MYPTDTVGSLPAVRRSNILNFIDTSGSATIRELAVFLNVSEATVRRDLDELAAEKMLERTRGGAQSLRTSRTAFEAAYRDKASLMVEEKQRIGACAASYVEDGDTILLDTGTTTLQIASQLAEKKNITVITYDLYIATTIELDASSTLIVPGGTRRPGFGVLVGPVTKSFLQGIRVDKTFLAADAVSPEFGVSNATLDEADLKKVLISSAQKVFLVADHSKFGSVSLVHVCPLSDLNLIITDKGLPAAYQEKLTEMGCTYLML